MKEYWCIWKNTCRKTFLVMAVTLLNASLAVVYPQAVQQKATRQSAINAFTAGKFDIAYSQFTELSSIYPKDPLYKYYRGASLVKLEMEPMAASRLLEEAIKESAAIRSVPADALFYLGRARQMSGDFDAAVKSFEDFTAQAGKKTAKEMNVPDLIKQCEAGKGIISAQPEAKNDELQKNAAAAVNPVAENVATDKNPPSNDTLDNKADELPDSYEKLLSEALDLQNRSDSVLAIATKSRKDMENAEGTARSGMWAKIQELDKQSVSYRAQADLKMAEAEKLSGTSSSGVQDTVDEKKAETVVISASVIKNEDNKTKNNAIKADTTVVSTRPVSKAIKPVVTTEIFSDFKVTEKPVFKPDEKVPVNPEAPRGLVYRIQIAVFKNPVSPSYFKGISPINGFKNPTSGVTTYYAGLFRKNSDAVKVLSRVKSKGFKDAFVVALMDKKAVSIEKAAILEKEWSKKPLYTVTPAKTETVRDTVPQTLVLRVEIKRSAKPLPKEQVENIKKISGNRGFDIIITEKKQNIYLVGTFLTFKSASEFSDLLVRNGFQDAKVVAYLGKREIPLETARQLFDEY